MLAYPKECHKQLGICITVISYLLLSNFIVWIIWSIILVFVNNYVIRNVKFSPFTPHLDYYGHYNTIWLNEILLWLVCGFLCLTQLLFFCKKPLIIRACHTDYICWCLECVWTYKDEVQSTRSSSKMHHLQQCVVNIFSTN